MKWLIITWLLILPATTAGQIIVQHDEFVGTWALNVKKSHRWPHADQITWTLDGANQILLVKRRFLGHENLDQALLLSNDGRGEENNVLTSATAPRWLVKSKTKWEGNTLVRKFVTEPASAANIGTHVTERYWLSKDGKQLFLEILSVARVAGFPDVRTQHVFDRKE